MQEERQVEALRESLVDCLFLYRQLLDSNKDIIEGSFQIAKHFLSAVEESRPLGEDDVQFLREFYAMLIHLRKECKETIKVFEGIQRADSVDIPIMVHKFRSGI
jgi:hypothetical protein